MHTLSVIASEGIKNRDLWYPTILGVLVVIAAVALFCGTPYLLLATNMGARLGFVVAAACLAGLMVLMSLLWLTNPSPVNTLHGRTPEWVAVEVIESGDLARSDIPAVQRVDQEGQEANDTQVANLKAAVDTNLVQSESGNVGEAEVGATSSFAVYTDATDFIVTKNQVTGGGGLFSQVDVEWGGGWPWVHVSLHKPFYGIVTICETDPATAATEVPFGQAPPEPKCASDARKVVVLEYNYGSLRVPPFVALLASSLLFGLCLLSLHWRERDLQEEAAAAGTNPESA